MTAVSTMLATGGSAVIMKKMGEQKTEEAKQDFTFLILVNVVVGIVMCGAGYVAMEHIFAGMYLSDHGCRLLYADKAAGIGICPAG